MPRTCPTGQKASACNAAASAVSDPGCRFVFKASGPKEHVENDPATCGQHGKQALEPDAPTSASLEERPCLSLPCHHHPRPPTHERTSRPAAASIGAPGRHVRPGRARTHVVVHSDLGIGLSGPEASKHTGPFAPPLPRGAGSFVRAVHRSGGPAHAAAAVEEDDLLLADTAEVLWSQEDANTSASDMTNEAEEFPEGSSKRSQGMCTQPDETPHCEGKPWKQGGRRKSAARCQPIPEHLDLAGKQTGTDV
eukprot:gb/GFBE01059746.1/.p1 GENE.gb/GFBE01059746.1/~~gb/GFBE01059746.1/.p1  ORF type:complete len:251 (+),score=7.54 gb/GFBE01059746.1/:1-753(+)